MTRQVIYVSAVSPNVPKCPIKDCSIPVGTGSMDKFGVKVGGCSHVVSRSYDMQTGTTTIGFVDSE